MVPGKAAAGSVGIRQRQDTAVYGHCPGDGRQKQQKELYAKALAYAAQMSGDDDVRAETVNRLKKLTE